VSAHVEDRLSPYLDGELSAGERDRVESHLRGCPACARHLEELRAVDAAARALPLEAPAGYFGSFSGRLRERLPQRRARRWPAWALAAAAGLALAVLVPLSARRVVSPVPEAVKTDALRSSTPTTLVAASPAFAEPPRVRAKTAAEPGAARRPPPAAPPAGATPAPMMASREQLKSGLYAQKRSGPSAQEPSSQAAANQAAPAAAPAAGPAPASVSGAAERLEGAEEKNKEGPLRKIQRDEASRGVRTDAQLMRADEDVGYQSLLVRQAGSVDEARRLADAWKTFAETHPASPRADEARVRAIEARGLAWRLSHDPADLDRVRQSARAYLASSRAPQRERVRALLETLPASEP